LFGLSATGIPLETSGGSGTRDVHWSETTFNNELMTGYLNSGVENPLSRMTAAQFVDLGYPGVNVNGADVYTPPGGGNARPVITSLSDSPDPVAPSSSLALVANSVSDANGTVASVKFYRETNGITGLQVMSGAAGDVSGDLLLSTDTTSADGFSATVSTSGLVVGTTYTYYAQALDNQNLNGVAVSTTSTVQNVPPPPAPTIALSSGSDSGTIGDNITNDNTPTFVGTAQALSTVRLYSDAVLVGTATTTAGGAWSITASTLADGARAITATAANVSGTGSASSPISLVVDTVAPALVTGSPAGAEFVYQSLPHRLIYRFTEDVAASTDAGDFTVQRLTPTSATVTISSLTDNVPSTNAATVQFSSSSLSDGTYRATLLGSAITDKAGNAVATSTYDFFALGGDANHDAKVNIADLLLVAQNWNGTGKTFAQGDFNYDGKVNATDLGILSLNWQKAADGSVLSSEPLPSLGEITAAPTTPVRPVVAPIRTPVRIVTLISATSATGSVIA
jgi:hypothetical protein